MPTKKQLHSVWESNFEHKLNLPLVNKPKRRNMKTNQKLSDLSLSDLISLYNYLNEELDALDNCIGVEDRVNELHEQIVLVQQEIEKRRNNIFGN